MKPETAFDKWLLEQPRAVAIHHVIQCLASSGELAWELMERAYGPDWKCVPSDLPGLIARALDRMERHE